MLAFADEELPVGGGEGTITGGSKVVAAVESALTETTIEARSARWTTEPLRDINISFTAR